MGLSAKSLRKLYERTGFVTGGIRQVRVHRRNSGHLPGEWDCA
ncbi:hypothetical protein HMPREF0733_11364 [Rothia dentocariosa ATCC 17931]|uniref:Uncharacterized protein n=1 Tax=Rothia dentocariosa (strain ATCC 17931 / CDC X599 / XDIA) TaxID=762948 RepID=E3H5I8_ROTDC|nr:hypothetical protein HMPREF0733_11364 [Rothia dentocariosa ATCC 17931]